ncbi:CpaF family protein [Paenibacillus lemnae]|uniref:CpaF family protein n=1 Tax=Paenibacillus lemnae TaxID=1330551 RepID=A0A848M6S9_PAELE|nr:CpaF family protein [Paenibacillus lemnae]NMO95792.1 CpaF family protein [Paenibacillus lemnae]
MHDEDLFQALRNEVRSGLDMSAAVGNRELMQYIEESAWRRKELAAFTAADKRRLIRRVFDSFRGLDVLQPLVDNPTITEIMINSHQEVFIEQEGEVKRLDVQFESRSRLEDIIQSVVGSVNRVVNESSPIVDARLGDGSRVNIVLPPIALKGPTMTIRKFPESPMTMDQLVGRGALTPETADLLRVLVKGKYNIFISGGTGSGKTTFLNALSQFIPPDERVITIEDSAELNIATVPNLVSLETRNANTEGRGEISIRDLIRSSLRMRPNRIIVGEVRGSEALDMLQAMNTGHDGSLSTGHSNSTKDMISRLETMVLSGADLPVPVVRQQISSAIDIFVHLSRLRDRSRRVTEISEVTGIHEGEVRIHSLYRFVEHGEREGKVLGSLEPCGNRLTNISKLQMAGITEWSLQEVEDIETTG